MLATYLVQSVSCSNFPTYLPPRFNFHPGSYFLLVMPRPTKFCWGCPKIFFPLSGQLHPFCQLWYNSNKCRCVKGIHSVWSNDKPDM